MKSPFSSLANYTAPRLEPLVDKLLAIKHFMYIFFLAFFLGLCVITQAAGAGWWMPFVAVGAMVVLAVIGKVFVAATEIGLLRDEDGRPLK